MAKNLTQKKVTLLWALPGSGKTHYCEEQKCNEYHGSVVRLDIDQIGRYCQQYGLGNVATQVAGDTILKLSNKEAIILDGLCCTNDVADNWMESIQKNAEGQYKINFEIIWWTPDREACLHNDQARRGENSTVTILNHPFEEPSAELVAKYKAKVVRKGVKLKPAHKTWASLNGVGDVDTLESSSWSLGGSWGDYNGMRGTVSPSDPPTNFKELDDLLEQTCPHITFLQYRKMYAACVTVKQNTESDYYGGSTTYARYVCDLKKLHDSLTEMGVIQ